MLQHRHGMHTIPLGRCRCDAEIATQIEAEIDEQTKALWGLVDAELKDIRDSLEDLKT